MKIIAATAYVFNEKIREVFECGMDDYLAKPI
jgi:CheY-like chemotaxis protein